MITSPPAAQKDRRWLLEALAKSPFLFKAAKTLSALRRNGTSLEMEGELNRELARVASTKQQILVGPWLSEVGFEILYWVPLVRWCLARHGIDPSRVTVLSRGGAGIWYEGCHNRYVEIFDLVSPAEFKARNLERAASTGVQKQLSVTDFDRTLAAGSELAGYPGDFFWLHPRYMYRLFASFWTMNQPISLVGKYGIHAPRPKPARPKGVEGDYVAVKFYFNDSFPDNASNRDFIDSLLGRLSAKGKVMLLNTGISVDDHSESRSGSGSLSDLSPRMQPRDNLDFQTRVLANAKAFYGTYGGFSYIAPYYGVPSFAFYSAPKKFVPAHLDAAHLAVRALGDGMAGKSGTAFPGYSAAFVPMDVAAFDSLQETLLS